VSILAPTDLLYHIGNYQGAIAVRMNVGAPYVLDRPAVTGTVTGYSVSPALPAGLSLNPSTGMISGTPLAKTGSGYALDGSFDRNPTGTVTKFSTVGCRAN
jgi:putative Ig domain-containing protein